MTWEEICADPLLAKLPYRIESDKWGNIVMSPPPGFKHSGYQGKIIVLLSRLLPHGEALGECPVRTAEGVKATDAAWMSHERIQKRPMSSAPCLVAPEICVEVRSPSNSKREITEKFALYFGKEAAECWMCDKDGAITFYDVDGSILHSRICPEFPVKLSL